MPFAIHRGQRIHYSLQGAGDLIVLQHGLLLDSTSWEQGGIVEALADRFQVTCIDSLGHGLSDKPLDASLYGQEERAGDVVAVLDAIGCERAHVVGHSMGGWLAVGLAKFHPRRLASLVVGGWDVVRGLPEGKKGHLRFEDFMAFARRTAPRLTKWVTPDLEPGVRACFDALSQLDGARAALISAGVPVMLWNGRSDLAHDRMKSFAATEGLQFLSVEGDHLGVIFRHGTESATGIRSFLATRSPRHAT
jgi:pimeloyl-ACP methyl ester carboxylesterase